MASVIERLQDRTASSDERARVLELRDDDSDEVLDALAPETRRHAYRELFETPLTTSELAERLDTSVQNVQYHLRKLQDVELVEPIDTVYSAKGNEMTVYGPASDPLVFVGDGDRYPAVEQSIRRVVTGLALLATASLFVQWSVSSLFHDPAGDTYGVGPAGLGEYPPADSIGWLVFDVLEPGLVFFAGCLLVAALVVNLSRR